MRLNIEGVKKLDTEGAREELLKALVDSALESDLARGVVWSGPGSLPRRWLPHGSYHELYTLYCAHQSTAGEKCASASTFYRALSTSGWSKKLRFSPPSAHSKCSVCAKLRAQIQHAKGIQQHLEACDKLLRHLAGQYADRECYWTCRSRAKTSGDLVCIITDSMDRSKYSLPRYHRGRAPKDVETTKRPNCEVTTSIVHGVGIFTYIADEGQSTGSNWTIETLNRSLQHTHNVYQKWNKPVPGVVKIFADNTPKDLSLEFNKFFLFIKHALFSRWWRVVTLKASCLFQEVKNSIMGSWCSMMSTAGFVRTISHEHLPVGHTHEDIGPLVETPLTVQ